jgi:hypothetical protein
MTFNEKIKKVGILNAYLIDPLWKGPFPTRWPKEEWPIIDHLFCKTNQITKKGQLYSYSNGYKFKYIAGGIGTNTPTPSDITLQGEKGRFEITDQIIAAGQIDSFAEIPSGTGNMTWHEWGVFCDDATITAGSGTLYSRLLQTTTKSIGSTILLTYTLKETV